jgi:hypothetical protein
MTFPTRFQQKLEQTSGLKLKLKMNDNHSTMLSVRWEPDCARVSLHRMFLQAPQNVMQALACYIKQEDENINPNIRFFIEENLKKMDYSHLLNRKKIYTQGTNYNLRQIYQELNGEYFDNLLKLHITWFGKPSSRNKSRVTFGLFYDPLKLIKINRILDSPLFPDYVVSYVVYHEMLHSVCPSYHDENGMHRIHTKEFKERETEYRYFERAQQWIREHQENLFKEAI